MITYVDFGENKKFTNKKGENIVTSSSPDGFKNAGVLIEDNMVVIDIDCFGKVLTKKILKTLNYETRTVFTSRGAHLYFYYNDYKHVKEDETICLMGFPVEYKKKKNENTTITVKTDGVEREVLHPEIIMDLPFEFQQQLNTYEDLRGMVDGDGRYNTVLKQLSRQFIDRDKLLTVISNYIFEQPFSNKNLLSLINAGRNNVAPNKKMIDENPNLDVDFIMSTTTPTKLGTDVFYRIDNVWVNEIDIITRYIYEQFQFMNSHRVSEIMTQISMRCTIAEQSSFSINFKNGMFSNGKAVMYHDDEFTPYTINREYKEDLKKPKALEQFFNFVTNEDEELEDYIFQVYAASLIPSEHFRKAESRMHILFGDGGNGKGVTSELFSRALGYNNKGSVKLEQFADKDDLLSIKWKLLNIGEDIENKPIDNKVFAIVKNITTGETVTKRGMYQTKSSQMVFTTNCIFTSNHRVKSFEKGTSFKRRIYYIPLLRSMFDDIKNNKNTLFTPEFFKELHGEDVADYIFARLIDTATKMYSTWGFYKDSKRVLEFTNEYHSENDNTSVYVQDILEEMTGLSLDEKNKLIDTKFINRTKKDVYVDYQVWCDNEGVNPIALNTLIDVILKNFGLKVSPRKIAGKSMRVFVEDKSVKKQY